MDINYMSVKEFREKGYLQELNRQFLHPLGLAIEVEIDDGTGEERFGKIWDSRQDPEGIMFDLEHLPQERVERFRKKANYVANEYEKRRDYRIKLLGDVIERIPE